MAEIENIIRMFVKKKEFKILFRPHPLDLTKKGNFDLVKKINNKFRNFKNFIFDNKISYNDSFIQSDILITDLSSTAYTYSFSTLKPVLFFSKCEKDLKKQSFFKTNYFNDRKKIGALSEKVKLLPYFVKMLLSKKYQFQKKIKNLRKRRIQNLLSSKMKTIETINKII